MTYVTIDNVIYLLNTSNNTASVTGSDNPPSNWNLTIQSPINVSGTDYIVTSIGDRAFVELLQLKTIIILNTLLTIGDFAFTDSGLTNISLDSVTTIGSRAFENCPLQKTLIIPNSVISLGYSCFGGCGLEEVIIADNIEIIPSEAFYGNAFGNSYIIETPIVFPNNIKFINDKAFWYGDNMSYIWGTLRSNTLFFPATLQSIGNQCFYLYSDPNYPSKIIFDSPNTLQLVGTTQPFSIGGTNLIVQYNNYTQGSFSLAMQTLFDYFNTIENVQFIYKTTTILSNFSILTKTTGDAPFNITPPTTNSDGSFSYTSSNSSVATIAGNTVTIVGSGNTIITCLQSEASSYTSGTITTTFTVLENSPENPAQLSTGDALQYFLDSNAVYASINSDVTVAEDLIATTEKTLINYSENTIFIYKN